MPINRLGRARHREELDLHVLSRTHPASVPLTPDKIIERLSTFLDQLNGWRARRRQIVAISEPDVRVFDPSSFGGVPVLSLVEPMNDRS